MAVARALLSYPDFRWLWLGQTVSVVGDRMVLVALALFVTQQSGSPYDVGLVLAAYTAPLVLFLLLGGVWADRLPRQRVMIVSDLVRFTVHASLAALIFTGEVEIWMVMALEALFGTAEAFFRPAYTGLIPQTVPEELIGEAQAMTQAAAHTAEFAGPVLATVLVLHVGAGYAFTVDAATFLVSAALLARLRPRTRGTPAARSTLLRELREGYREVRSRNWVWVTIAVFSAGLFVGLAPWFVLGPTVAIEQYGTAAVFGLAVGALGAGTLCGSIIGMHYRPARPMLTAFLVLAPWPLLPAALALGAPRAAVLALAFATGIGFAIFSIAWETSLAQRIPPHALSRVSAYDWMGSLGLLPIGYLVAAPAAHALGASTVLLVGAALLAVALAVGFAPRETRELRRPEPSAPETTPETQTDDHQHAEPAYSASGVT